MFRSARFFLWSESRHRHIVIRSAAGLFCSNPSVHHSDLLSELLSDNVLGDPSILLAGKSDTVFIYTAMTLDFKLSGTKKKAIVANYVQTFSDIFLRTFLSF